jgi:serine/threonine protein kinase
MQGTTAKITDFGTSFRFSLQSGPHAEFGAITTERKLSKNVGTPDYCAPEILDSKKYTEKVDIFSLGTQ